MTGWGEQQRERDICIIKSRSWREPAGGRPVVSQVGEVGLRARGRQAPARQETKIMDDPMSSGRAGGSRRRTPISNQRAAGRASSGLLPARLANIRRAVANLPHSFIISRAVTPFIWPVQAHRQSRLQQSGHPAAPAAHTMTYPCLPGLPTATPPSPEPASRRLGPRVLRAAVFDGLHDTRPRRIGHPHPAAALHQATNLL